MVNPDKTSPKRKHTAGKLEKWTHMLMVEQVFPTFTKFGLESQNLWNNGSNVTAMVYLKTLKFLSPKTWHSTLLEKLTVTRVHKTLQAQARLSALFLRCNLYIVFHYGSHNNILITNECSFLLPYT
jgi:hypothetical protein